MPFISLFLLVRITDDKFHNFVRFFQSVVNCVDDPKNLEILVKFDDDQDISKALEVIEEFRKKGLEIKYISTPRGKGFQYLSYFLLDLMFIANRESKLFVMQSIDFHYIKKGFDTIMIEASKKYEDEIFVIHPNFKLSLKSQVIDINQAAQIVEAYPFWSRKWIEIQSVFGYNSFMDGYTSLVEYFLLTEYGIDRRIDLSEHKLVEETDMGGFVDSPYWQGPRKTSMKIHLTPQSIAFARQAAKNLALNISNSWKRDDYTNYLVKSCLNVFDENLLMTRVIKTDLKNKKLKTKVKSLLKKLFLLSKKRK